MKMEDIFNGIEIGSKKDIMIQRISDYLKEKCREQRVICFEEGWEYGDKGGREYSEYSILSTPEPPIL